MVEPQFPKRADAKNAVCLAALAAGIGAYVHAVNGALEAKISPETRALVMESILPLLTTEYAKYWPNKLPEMFEYTKDRDGMHDHIMCSSARRFHPDYLYVSPANGCILTLKLTEEPEEREKCSWEAPADFRNRNDAKVAVVQLAFEQGAIEFLRFRGVSPPEGYRVELPAPRESKKAKRKGMDGAGAEGEGTKKKTRLLSQTEQFRAAKLPQKPTEARAFLPPRPATSGAAILLPRPGYIDPKPEPGELPAEAPKHDPEPEQQPSKNLPPQSAVQPSRQPLEYPPRPIRTAEPSSYDRFQDHPRPTAYDTREHGHQYELDDSWYDDSGAHASDPYYAPPQASYTEPWHAPSFVPTYPEEDGHSRSYYDVDYGHDYDRSYGFDYDYDDYDYERDHHAVPPPPSGPVPAHGYADFEHSGYDDYDYAHEHHYTHAHPHGHMQHPPGPWQDHPAPRSPPRVWEPGPRAGKVEARRSGAAPESRPPPELIPRASVAADVQPGPGPVRRSASALAAASSSSSPSSTPAGSLRITRTAPPEPASEPSAKPTASSVVVSIKDELFGTFEGHFLVAPHPS